MNYSEKIKASNEKIAKAEERISKDHEKIKGWKKEIIEYENLEVQGMLKEHNLSVKELREFLLMKTKKEENVLVESEKSINN